MKAKDGGSQTPKNTSQRCCPKVQAKAAPLSINIKQEIKV